MIGRRCDAEGGNSLASIFCGKSRISHDLADCFGGHLDRSTSSAAGWRNTKRRHEPTCQSERLLLCPEPDSPADLGHVCRIAGAMSDAAVDRHPAQGEVRAVSGLLEMRLGRSGLELGTHRDGQPLELICHG